MTNHSEDTQEVKLFNHILKIICIIVFNINGINFVEYIYRL